jgi:hypothetical protein
MAKLGKRAKRLTKLRIHEVSVCDAGAGRGVRIALMKRRGDQPERRWRWGPAYNLIPAEGDDGSRAETIAAAKREIAENWSGSGLGEAKLSSGTEYQSMEINIAKAMEVRTAAIMKSDPSVRSPESAMLKLAESRDPQDQALWRAYKSGVMPASAPVEKTINVEKTMRKVDKRIAELQAVDPSLSRLSAIAKIASSPGDRELWERYKALGPMDEYVTSGNTGSPSRRPSAVAFEALVTAIRASNPGMSDATARQWARATQAHKPPAVQRLVGHPI